MKKRLLTLLCTVLCLVIGLTFVACGGTGENKDEYTYSLSKTTLTLQEGGSEKLTVTVTPTKEISPEFKSSDTAIATVAADGTVTAVKAGKATVTAKVDDKTLTCQVTVTAAATEYEYTLSMTTMSLAEEATRKLIVSVEPEKTIAPTFESSDTAVATVAADGTVTAVAVGTCDIIVKVDGKTLKCALTVTAKPIEYEYELSEETLSLGLGDTTTLTVDITPANPDAIVLWETQNDKVATVANGVVKAVGAGSTVVTATIDETVLNCAVTVTSPIAATATVTDISMKTAIINGDNVIYNERYSYTDIKDQPIQVDVTRSADEQTFIPEDTNGVFALTHGFYDYKAALTEMGVTVTDLSAYTKGLHTSGDNATVTVGLNLTKDVKFVRVYTGGWKATGTASLWYNGVPFVTSLPYIATEAGLASAVDFAIDYTDDQPIAVELKLVATGVGVGGNVSIVDIAMLSAAMPALDSTIVTGYTKTDYPDGGELQTLDLNESGNYDYFLPGASAEKDNGEYIKTDTYTREGMGGGADYRAILAYGNTQTRKFHASHKYTIDVSLDKNVKSMTFYLGSWQQSMAVYMFDANDALVYSFRPAIGFAGSTVCKLDINVTETATYKFVLLGVNSDHNCWLGGIAVEGLSYSLSPATSQIKVGETQQLTLTTNDTDFDVTYTSSNDEFATVDADGLVTGVAAGTVTITATIGEFTAEATVVVVSADTVYEYALSETTKTLAQGDTFKPTVNVTPSAPAVMPAMTWASSNTAVATVAEDGTITAIKGGTANITVTVDGVANPLTLALTVTDVLSAAATVTDIGGQNVVFGAANENSLYFEQYHMSDGKVVAEASATNQSYIPAETNGALKLGHAFGDYKAILFVPSANREDWRGTTHSVHSAPGVHEYVSITVNLTSQVKRIRVYTGGWNSTSTVSAVYKNVQLVVSDTYIADDTAIARAVDVNFNYAGEQAIPVEIRINTLAGSGNSSVVGIQLFGDQAATCTVTGKKVGDHDNDHQSTYSLDEVGDLDWVTVEDGNPRPLVGKEGGTLIDENIIRGAKYKDGGNDNRVTLSYTANTEQKTSRNFWSERATVIDVTVNQNVKNIRLFAGSWQMDTFCLVRDEQGRVLYFGQMKNNFGGATVWDYAISTETEQKLTFAILGVHGDNGRNDTNVWFAGLAVSSVTPAAD